MSDPEQPNRWVRRFLDRQIAPATGLVIAAGLVFVVALGDLATGPYLVFSPFYLLGVVFAAWFGGRRRGVAVAVFAAVCGVVTSIVHRGVVPGVAMALNGLFRLAVYALMAVLVAAEHASQRRIAELTYTDPLTGLANLREFYRRGELELRRARRDGSELALVYLDVDDLKLRNDRFGHRAGDAMLVAFAEIARSTFRAEDLLARVGGDEFAFLLIGSGIDDAGMVVERFTGALQRSAEGRIAVSVGVIAGTVDEATELGSVLGDADALMYEAKQSGKGRVRRRASLSARS